MFVQNGSTRHPDFKKKKNQAHVASALWNQRISCSFFDRIAKNAKKNGEFYFVF